MSSQMEKRYQVFVSSTFRDLQDERQEVMQALLELDCIPAGMELFPAANEDQWSLIKKVIDDCDYYIVILGGRYGSLGPDGIGYTEMEYQYALERDKPVIGFVHRVPGALAVDRSETDPAAREKLDIFRNLVQKKMCRFWDTPADLGSQVSRSLVKLIKANPAIGWIRSDQLGEAASGEVLRLRRRIEELELGIQASRTQAPSGTEHLSQGDDRFAIAFTFQSEPVGLPATITLRSIKTHLSSLESSWHDVFAAVAPLMIDEVTDEQLKQALSSFIYKHAHATIEEDDEFFNRRVAKFTITNDAYQTIKVQLRALGLIGKSSKSRSVKDANTYWSLTPYGDAVMTRLRAIRRAVRAAG